MQRIWQSTGHLAVVTLLVPAVISGCTSWSETAGRHNLATHVGIYSPPPPWIQPARVGVPTFQVSATGTVAGNLGDLAAGQLTSLILQTGRFRVMDLRGSESSRQVGSRSPMRSGRKSGAAEKGPAVEYVFVGRVANLRVVAEGGARSFVLRGAQEHEAGVVTASARDYSGETVSVECGIDLKLIHSASGKTVAAQRGFLQRKTSLLANGIEVVGVDAGVEGDLTVDENGKRLILRVALDDALRKMIPAIDRLLAARSKGSGGAPDGETLTAQSAKTAVLPRKEQRLTRDVSLTPRVAGLEHEAAR